MTKFNSVKFIEFQRPKIPKEFFDLVRTLYYLSYNTNI